MSQTAKGHKVYFLLYEDLEILDVTGPASVLTQANKNLGHRYYEIHYVSPAKDGSVQSSTGLALSTDPLPRRIPDIGTLVVPGGYADALEKALNDTSMLNWLRRASGKAKRIASICTGAVLLGELDLLDKKQVTTHWLALDWLREQNPKAQVEEDTLYTRDGDLWTSAGVLSGVDMMLALVSHDHGPQLALKIARYLVVYVIRNGGQNQFSGPMDFQTRAGCSEFVTLIAWLESRLDQEITVEAMAEKMCTSVRTLHRRCREVLDLSPAQLLSELRLEHSRMLLHQASVTIKSIAYECGFSNSSAFSKAFTRRFGVCPQHYRDHFREDG